MNFGQDSIPGGPGVNPINSQGGTATATSPQGPTAPGTTHTTDGEAAIESAAVAANFPETYALWIDEGMGWTVSQTLSHIPALGAAYVADPGQSPAQLAVSVLGADPNQAAAINKIASADAASAGTSSGLVTDIFGDFFETAYPFLMLGLAALLFIAWVVIAILAIGKSPVAKSALSGASAGAGFAALAG